MQNKFNDFPHLVAVRRSFFDTKRTWLNILLFAATLFSAFFVGISWSLSYLYAESISRGEELAISSKIFLEPDVISLSLIYAAVLIAILLAHEMGHYLTCRYYRIDATLPFFIPAPTLIGTMGAFIKIKSPITRKHQLFDIGAAGPLAGFVLALPAIFYGISLSKIVPALPSEGSILFGDSLLVKQAVVLFLKDIPAGYDIVVHPIAFAGWVGILVTALNLFPIGQLDGGHILYAFLGPRSRKLAPWLLLAFIVMGIFFWVGWFVWAILISFLGFKHPPVLDEGSQMSQGRKILGIAIIIIFIVSFIPKPIHGNNLFEILEQFI